VSLRRLQELFHERGRHISDYIWERRREAAASPSTAIQIAERAGLLGRQRAMHAARALVRLEADAHAGSTNRRNVIRWRSAAAVAASARYERDPAG
jgi:hypothetical protein